MSQSIYTFVANVKMPETVTMPSTPTVVVTRVFSPIPALRDRMQVMSQLQHLNRSWDGTK